MVCPRNTDPINLTLKPKQNLVMLHQTLTQLLQERDAFFPKRDPKNTETLRKTMSQYITTLHQGDQNSWQPSQALLAQASTLVDKAVFICGYMKCGITLLGNLLDNHPEIVALPGDSHMVKFLQTTTTYQKVKTNTNTASLGHWQNWKTYWISRLINPTGQAPFWLLGKDDEAYLNFAHYLGYWLTYLPMDKRRPFLAVILAFYCANPQRPERPQLWIEKTPENETQIDFILQLFPSARFLHIVRDPRANCASLKQLHHHRTWPWSVEHLAFNINRSMAEGLAQQKQLGSNRYYLLRYEDLVEDTLTEMEKVAQFLRVQMNEILLNPTVNGQKAKSNSMHQNRQIEGQIANTFTDRSKEILSSYEQKIISTIPYKPAQELGYEQYEANWAYFSIARCRQIIFQLLTKGQKLLSIMRQKFLG